MKKILFNANATYVSLGLLILRVSIGTYYIYNFGFEKITNKSNWPEMGGAMNNFGIYFAPALWGFMAAFAEFFGSAFLILGLFSRISAILLAFTMFVATYTEYTAAQDFSTPLEMTGVFLALLITGPGRYSIDAQISGFKK